MKLSVTSALDLVWKAWEIVPRSRPEVEGILRNQQREYRRYSNDAWRARSQGIRVGPRRQDDDMLLILGKLSSYPACLYPL